MSEYSRTAILSEIKQAPISSLTNSDWDVIVIGAGPAGSTAARALAGHGDRVLLVDKYRFPREKVCGDCIIGDSIRFLEAHGLYDKVAASSNIIPTAAFYSPSGHTFELSGRYLSIERAQFDLLLAQTAVDAGAIFAEGSVTEINPADNKRVTVRFGPTGPTIHARVCLIATGANIELAKSLGMVVGTRPYAFAVRCYVRSDFALDKLVMWYGRPILPGYGWIIPMGKNLFNLGCGTYYGNGTRPEPDVLEGFQTFVTEFGLARDMMQNGEVISRLRGAPIRCALEGTKPIKRPNILVTGESIGTTYPFTGEGIGKAMESGQIAADVIHESLTKREPELLQNYYRRIESELKPRYRAYLMAQRWLTKPWLNDFLTKRISRSGYLRDSIGGSVTKSGAPRRVYTIWNIVQSFFR